MLELHYYFHSFKAIIIANKASVGAGALYLQYFLCWKIQIKVKIAEKLVWVEEQSLNFQDLKKIIQSESLGIRSGFLFLLDDYYKVWRKFFLCGET